MMEIDDSELFVDHEEDNKCTKKELDAILAEIKYSEVFADYEDDDYIDQEWIDCEIEKERRKREDELRNIHRDKRGRLNKGALLAKKNNCDEERIQRMYDSGMTVKEIIEFMRCSKSTVYNAINKHKE